MDAIDASIIILTKNGGSNFKFLPECIFLQEFDGKYKVLAIDSVYTNYTLNNAQEFDVKITQIQR